MRGYQTAATVANAVKMLRAQHPAVPFLLVEDDTDVRLWRRFVVSPCVILDAEGRTNAEGALALLTTPPVAAPVAAIVDADFDRLEGRVPAHPGLFWTDGHDVEVMMLGTPALAAVLRERASAVKMAGFEGGTGAERAAPSASGLHEEEQVDGVRHALFVRALPLGALRLHNHRLTLNLDFKALQLKKVCEHKRWTMDVPELLRLVAAHNSRPGITAGTLRAAIAPIVAEFTGQERELCRGHDLLALLALGLQTMLGSWTATDMSGEFLERELRLAFDRECLQATGLYRAVEAWQAATACQLWRL